MYILNSATKPLVNGQYNSAISDKLDKTAKDKLAGFLFDKCLNESMGSDYDFSLKGYREIGPTMEKIVVTGSFNGTATASIQQIAFNSNLPQLSVPYWADSLPLDAFDKLESAGINLEVLQKGATDLARLQKIGESAQSQIMEHMKNLGITGDAQLSVDTKTGYVTVELSESNQSYLSVVLEKAVNSDSQLKELLNFAASGLEMASGKADGLVYEQLKTYLSSYFDQDLSGIGFENGVLTGLSPKLEEAVSLGGDADAWESFLRQNGIPSFWGQGDTGLVTETEYAGLIERFSDEKKVTSFINHSNRETSEGFKAMLAVLAQNGVPPDSEPVILNIKSGELQSNEASCPLSKNQISESQKSDFDLLARYAGANVYKGFQYYQNQYDSFNA